MNKPVNPCVHCHYARMKTDICGIYCTGGFENPDGTCDHFRDSRETLTERTDSMDKEKLIEALNRECSQCTRYGKAYNPPCLRCSGFKKNFRWVGGTKDELQAEVAEAFKSQAAQLAEKDKQLAAAVELVDQVNNVAVEAIEYGPYQDGDEAAIFCRIERMTRRGPQEAGEGGG